MTQDTGRTAMLGAQRFVALTTFKRTGEPIATTVWITRDGDDLLVLTPAASWKVKRLHHDRRVRLVPSTRSGKVTPGAEAAEGTAVIETDPATVDRLNALVRAKYGLEYRIVMAVERLFGGAKPRVILRMKINP